MHGTRMARAWHTHIHMHMHTHTHTNTHARTRTHTHTHTHTHTRTRTRTHTHMYGTRTAQAQHVHRTCTARAMVCAWCTHEACVHAVPVRCPARCLHEPLSDASQRDGTLAQPVVRRVVVAVGAEAYRRGAEALRLAPEARQPSVEIEGRVRVDQDRLADGDGGEYGVVHHPLVVEQTVGRGAGPVVCVLDGPGAVRW